MPLKQYIYSIMTNQRRNILVGAGLRVLSLLYGLIVWVTRHFYQWHLLPSYQAPRPVISIGNITVGGTGKTPLVVAVVRFLLMRQYKVAVLTRGYMPKGTSTTVSDEVQLLKEELPGVPVLVGSNRRLSIEEGLTHHAIDVFVCDDAFSHWPLRRDLDVLAVDAGNPFGNRHLLPRGILREPLSAINRSHMVVLTKCPQDQVVPSALVNEIKAIKPDMDIFESRHTIVGCVDVFEGKPVDHIHFKGVRVLAFCAIGDPNAFKQSLQEAGFDCVNLMAFMDHHEYTSEDLAGICRYAMENQIQMIMTTHKDAVKIRRFSKNFQGYKLYYLQMELSITHGKNVFIDRIIAAANR